MCDTFVVVRPGEVLFGKNSDRDPNEAQRIVWAPRRAHARGTALRCTWSVIPQVEATHAVVLSRPYWMWGAEMGANERGVVVGNEAVFTRARPGEHFWRASSNEHERQPLLGMDLVRLALERAASADEACSVITSLVEAHGQGGRAGYDDPGFHYDSSFLVADAMGAWVLETAGRETARERVDAGPRAISNGLTIGGFAARWADPLRGWVAECKARRGRVESLAALADAPRGVARVLRDHGDHGDGEPRYRWLNGAMSAPCMHAGGSVVNSQTVASWISRLTAGGAEHYVTATAAPCLAGYKQIAVEEPLDLGEPTGADDGATPFWRFERLHRAIVGDPALAAEHRRARDAWEERTWSGQEGGMAAFHSFDAVVEDALAARREPDDIRPSHARRYWQARAEDARAASGKLPAR